VLQLEAVQGNDGDCLLLHFDDVGGKPGLILIDGGSKGVYKNFLQKRLDELRGSKPTLNLRLVVVSHIDADHITGILDMFRQMSEAVNSSQQPRWKVASIWHNAFEKLAGTHAPVAQSATVAAAANGSFGEQEVAELQDKGLDDPKAQAVIASVKQGKDLQSFAAQVRNKVGQPKINGESGGELIMAPEMGRQDIPITDSLTFTILGPHETELSKLEEQWNKSKAKHPADERSAAADYLNRTVPNLSSIVFMAEQKSAAGKSTRMLLTGDAGGDLILKGLETAGLLDANKHIRLDLLKVQHHGSNHSVTEYFFRQVIADKYLISGNGAHGIPHMKTLRWLSNARKDQEYDVYMTNRQLSDKGVDLTPGLTNFLNEERALQPKHRYHFREDSALSILPQ